VPEQGHAQSYAFINGNWFNGKGFEQQTVYVTDGLFTRARPAQIDSTYDLNNGYVIPPFAEAHNHNLDTDYMLVERINRYLREGVFYAKMQSSIKKRMDPNRHLFNHPTTIDVAFAHAPLTATGGHPVRLREDFFDLGRFDGLFTSKADIEGNGYVIIDSEQDLEEKWESVLAAEPDFIKGNLLYSEAYEDRKDDPAYFGHKGLNPQLLPAIVKKVHERGLRLSVHVNTPTDFHHAVVAGVDEINHLPSRDAENMEKIREEDARMAAEKKVVVVTTVSLVKRKVKPDDERLEAVKETIAYNLRLLKEHGVSLAIGSDMYNDTSLGEAMFLDEFGVFSNLELLKMWVENSPQTIFPERKIGHLAEGFEASFLVLEGNPLEDFDHVKDITMRFKQGLDLAGVLEEGAQ
jgi:imidazolonepropionase-like amidohydrolase